MEERMCLMVVGEAVIPIAEARMVYLLLLYLMNWARRPFRYQ